MFSFHPLHKYILHFFLTICIVQVVHRSYYIQLHRIFPILSTVCGKSKHTYLFFEGNQLIRSGTVFLKIAGVLGYEHFIKL